MNSRTLTCITAMTFFAALAAPLRLVAQKQIRYSVTDLGTLGGRFSIAEAINNKGWVDGSANLPGDAQQHATLWVHGLKIDLGTLGGPNSLALIGPNNRGQVVGQAETSAPDPNKKNFCSFFTENICRAFLWHNGVMRDLGTLGGNNSTAYDINNRGQVVGAAENTTTDTTCTTYQFQFKPAVWEEEEHEIRELPTFSGDPDGLIQVINDHGQAVGSSGKCNNIAAHALLWQDGTVTDLGSLGGTMYSVAFYINNRGQVVGTSDLPGDTTHHAFLWQNEAMADLGTLDFYSAALAVNEEGLIVGISCDQIGSCRALVWKNGVITDLNTLIPAGSPLHLFFAGGVNSRGQIVGGAINNNTGQFHAFLATPIDESSASGIDTPAAHAEGPQVTLPRNVRKTHEQPLGLRYHVPTP
jgi:probable HAF family extracellular repeat protein